VSNPTDSERRALEGLFGSRFSGASIPVKFDELDRRLQSFSGHGLVHWLIHIAGPLRDRPAESAARNQALDQVLATLDNRNFAESDWFIRWRNDLTNGTLARLHTTDSLADITRAADVLEQLPTEQLTTEQRLTESPRSEHAAMPVFASQYAGGTKALNGTALETLVLGALALCAGVAKPTRASERRSLWERFGVVADDLSSTVLCLNLPAVGDGFIDQLLRDAAIHGVPVRLTLHQLTRFAPTLDPSVETFVCENPAIVRMAAERLGTASRALIATEGVPSVAFWKLMEQSGPQRHVRADFDVAGLRICSTLLDRLQASPWRMDTQTYMAHRSENTPVKGRVPLTPWDVSLGQTMAGAARVEEEELIELLLADLLGVQRAPAPTGPPR
jgi:uncharacterized protein (TIGR02679 family)